jgi:hypothetical protein
MPAADLSPFAQGKRVPLLSMQSIIESNAALLRKLHETIRETFLHRSEGPEAHAAWERACREFHERWDELAFPGGLQAGLRRIEAGDMQAIDTAIRYLELRPFYFRAQYIRNLFTRLIKRHALPPKLQNRFDATRERLKSWQRARRERSDRLHHH